jgi:hypothetical protein
MQSKAKVGNMSNEGLGKPTLGTVIPTGTESTLSPEPTIPVETIVSKMITIVPKANTGANGNTKVDLGCLGTTNCHFYNLCMDGCKKNEGGDCEMVCCGSHCLDLPSEMQPSCANACLAQAGGAQNVNLPKPAATSTTLPGGW